MDPTIVSFLPRDGRDFKNANRVRLAMGLWSGVVGKRTLIPVVESILVEIVPHTNGGFVDLNN